MSVRARDAQRRCIDARPLLHAPFVLPAPLLSGGLCAALLDEAEQVAACRGGWRSSRHKNHPTVDLPLHELRLRTYHAVRRALDSVALTAMQAAYGCRQLSVREAFIVKYEAPAAAAGAAAGAATAPAGAAGAAAGAGAGAAAGAGGSAGGGAPAARRQAGLEMHRDGTLLNCVVLLNEPASFDGGGTVFALPLDRTFRTARGECLCSCGQLMHGAAAVTRGVRYVLIAFIDELQLPPDDDDDDDDDDADDGGDDDE